MGVRVNVRVGVRELGGVPAVVVEVAVVVDVGAEAERDVDGRVKGDVEVGGVATRVGASDSEAGGCSSDGLSVINCCGPTCGTAAGVSAAGRLGTVEGGDDSPAGGRDSEGAAATGLNGVGRSRLTATITTVAATSAASVVPIAILTAPARTPCEPRNTVRASEVVTCAGGGGVCGTGNSRPSRTTSAASRRLPRSSQSSP